MGVEERETQQVRGRVQWAAELAQCGQVFYAVAIVVDLAMEVIVALLDLQSQLLQVGPEFIRVFDEAGKSG